MTDFNFNLQKEKIKFFVLLILTFCFSLNAAHPAKESLSSITIIYPANWDGLSQNNPMLECNSGYLVDDNGNPDTSLTGSPSGWAGQCNNVEVFYSDQTYPVGNCGLKILRNWTVVDDCSGETFHHTQIIRITDTQAPDFYIPESIHISTNAVSCNAEFIVIPPVYLHDNCSSELKWWISCANTAISGDSNQNNIADSNETWKITGLSIGEYIVYYHAIDKCGNEKIKSTTIEVTDMIPPIASCEQYKTVSLTATGYASIFAKDFDSGSFDNCNPVWYKVLRVDNKGNYDNGCTQTSGDDDPTTSVTDVWFDDHVDFCCDDLNNKVMVLLRVFDKNPGTGPINPDRMTYGGDLYGHFNDCWNITTVECKFAPSIYCPTVSINYNESTDPWKNKKLLPQYAAMCGGELTYTDINIADKCKGEFRRNWTVSTCEKTATCIQKIKINGKIDFNPCSISFPPDLTISDVNDPALNYKPEWTENACNAITSYIEKTDTTIDILTNQKTINRLWAVKDLCVYNPDANNYDSIDTYFDQKLNCNDLKKDGLYKHNQKVIIFDTLNHFIDTLSSGIGFIAGIAPFDNTHLIAVSSDDKYEFILERGEFKVPVNEGSYEVYEYSDYDCKNGNSTLDIVILYKYLLGIKYIETPHILLASDVNGDRKITGQDVIEYLNVILRGKQCFTNNSYFSLNKDYQFLKPEKAYEEGGLSRIQKINVIPGAVSNVDFIFIKTGDLNLSAINLESRDYENAKIVFEDLNLNSDENQLVPVYAENFKDIAGIQLSLDFKNMESIDILPGKLNISKDFIEINDNNLKIAFASPNDQIIEDGSLLFTLNLRTKVDTKLSESISLNLNEFNPEIYTSELQIKKLDLDYRTSQNFDLYTNVPNPFTEYTTISFSLPEKSLCKLEMIDIFGKNVLTKNIEGKKGYNTFFINSEDFNSNQAGVYFVNLKYKDHQKTIKLIRL